MSECFPGKPAVYGFTDVPTSSLSGHILMTNVERITDLGYGKHFSK